MVCLEVLCQTSPVITNNYYKLASVLKDRADMQIVVSQR
jgi:hypothetical protein